MEHRVEILLNDIKSSREKVIDLVVNINAVDGAKKLAQDQWSIQEIIEHLVLAERGGFDLIYTAAERFRTGEPVWSGTSENSGLSIEEIIGKTWKTKEKAPPSATPQGKWSLAVWTAHFKNVDDLLLNLLPVLKDLPLEEVIYPHFLCGPLDAVQRLEFIRFHIDRHYDQIRNLKSDLGI